MQQYEYKKEEVIFLGTSHTVATLWLNKDIRTSAPYKTAFAMILYIGIYMSVRSSSGPRRHIHSNSSSSSSNSANSAK